MDYPILPTMRWLRRTGAGTLLLAVIFWLNPGGLATWAVNTAVHQEQRKQERLVKILVDSIRSSFPSPSPAAPAGAQR